MDRVGVSDAAVRLGVSPRRVRQMLSDGVLRGERLGRSWVVEQDELDRYLGRRRRAGGRPWSAGSAWAVLAEVEPDLDPPISPHQRWRAQHRLAEHGLRGLADSLIARARCRSFYGHPAVVERIADEAGVVRAGVSAARVHGADVLADEVLDAYVRRGRLASLVARYRLEPVSGGANVFLRVVPDAAWPFRESHRFAPRSVVALDLLEDSDERSRRAGAQLLAS